MSDSQQNLISAFEKHPGRWIAAAFVAVSLVMAGWFYRLATASSDIAFLPRRAPAQWIVFPKPPDGSIHHIADLDARFRRTFVLTSVPPAANLFIRGFQQWSITLNGVSLENSPTATNNWKTVTTRDVTSQLHAGTNEIVVTVSATNGLPALWLAIESGAPLLVSDTNWEVSIVGSTWQKALTASAPMHMMEGNPLLGAEHPVAAFLQSRSTLLMFTVLSILAFFLGRSVLIPRKPSAGFFKPGLLLLAVPVMLWVALFANNLSVLPFVVGFDSVHHLDYIKQVRTLGHLPLAGEGYQTYQPPLYYILSAVWMLPFDAGNWTDHAVEIIRVLGLGIGVLHLVLLFLCLRLLFPGRTGLQLGGLLFAAFVPEQLYISQYVTNEALSATFVTAAFYFCLRILKEDRDTPGLFAALGLCLGAALLTKITGIIAVPIFGAALVARLIVKRQFSPRVWASTIGVSVLVALLVCGWYYVRVWLHFGKVLVGNWDAAGGLFWWMERGYTTRAGFFGLHGLFSYPWFNGFNSFVGGLYSTMWGDGLWGGETNIAYRPPWNYQLMAAGYLLALIPMVVLLVGTVAAAVKFLRCPDASWFILFGTAFATLAALIYMALKVPAYGEVKSFYGLIALLPLCAFAAAGWDLLLRLGKGLAPAAAVLFGLWALTSYGSFWIPRWDVNTQISLGRTLEGIDRRDEAQLRYADVLRRDPNNTEALKGMARISLANRQLDGARQRIESVLRIQSNDASAHGVFAAVLVAQNQSQAALAEIARSVSLAPQRLDNYVHLEQLMVKLGGSIQSTAVSRAGLCANPLNAQLHYDLATALVAGGGSGSEALTHFRLAVELDPTWPDAKEQYGLSLLNARQPDVALPLFIDAVASRPSDERFHYNLALALNAVGNTADAVREYRRALALKADYPEALNNLAWILATDPDPALRNGADAVQFATRACSLTEQKTPVYLATLSAAYAEVGRFSDAINTITQAADAARTAGDTNFVSTCNQLLDFYRANRAYHRPARPSGLPPG